MDSDGSVIITAEIDDKKAQADLKRLEGKIERLRKDISDKKGEQGILKTELEAAKTEALKTTDAVQALKDELEQVRQITSIESAVGVGDPARVMAALEREKEITAELPEQEKMLKSQNKELERLAGQYAKVTDRVITMEGDLRSSEAEAGKLSAQLMQAHAPAENVAAASEEVAENVTEATEASEELGEKGEEAGERMREGFDFASTGLAKFERRIAGLIKRVFVFSLITSALRGLRSWLSKTVKTNDEAAAAIAQLKGALLTLAQPIIEVIIPAFIALVNVLTRVITAVAAFVANISGKSLGQTKDAAKALYEEQNALEGVGGAAKDASKSLAGFDEINQLSDNSGGGGGASATGQEIAPDFSFADDVKDKIEELEVYVSGALLALGAVLAFSGANIPLGIALMVAGAAGLAKVVAENWSEMPDNIKSALTKVSVVIGGALLAIGAILALSGAKIPLGIGLMVAGAASLAAAAALNWDKIKGEVETTLNALLPVLSASLLVLGAVLAFSGANLPLGIGLMIAGAVGLAAAVALNWDWVKKTLQGKVGEIAAIASAALLVLGLILALSGAALPLGIALIIAGAAGLVTVTALNWDAIKEKLKDAWDGIKRWFQEKVAPKLTLAYWQEKFEKIGDGLKTALKGGINAAIMLFNKFIGWVNEKMNISWAAKSILGQEVIPAGSLQLLHLKSIPLLAQGAVIPPNREFLAVLGDQTSGRNVEAPEALLRQMAQEAASANTALLEEILQAIRDGKVITVDRTVLGRTARSSMYDLARAGY